MNLGPWQDTPNAAGVWLKKPAELPYPAEVEVVDVDGHFMEYTKQTGKFWEIRPGARWAPVLDASPR